MEMSRQRIRSSVLESSTDKCPHCGGTGHVRSVSSVALHLLRMLEEMLIKGATHNLIVRTRSEVALYVLNHKRAHLREFESRFQITITVNADASMGAAQPFLIEKGEQVHSPEAAKAIAAQAPVAPAVEYADDDIADEVDEEEVSEEAEGAVEAEAAGEDSSGAEPEARDGEPRERGRRRRRGRGGREGREGGREPREGGHQPREAGFAHESTSEHATAHEGNGGDAAEPADGEARAERGPSGASGQNGDAEHRRRRRGRRGGRRNRRGREGEGGFVGANGGNDEHQEHRQGVEPEVADAVADLGGASPAEVPSAPEPQAPQPFEPVAREAPRDVTPEPAPQEQPRRRSTIREPAPVFSSGPMSDVQPSTPHTPAAPPPPPEPVVTTPEPAAASEEAPAKRRFGWWNKRS
jgi:ribonuclease E